MDETCPHCGSSRQAEIPYYVCGRHVWYPEVPTAACGELARCYGWIDHLTRELARMAARWLAPKVRGMVREMEQSGDGKPS